MDLYEILTAFNATDTDPNRAVDPYAPVDPDSLHGLMNTVTAESHVDHAHYERLRRGVPTDFDIELLAKRNEGRAKAMRDVLNVEHYPVRRKA